MFAPVVGALAIFEFAKPTFVSPHSILPNRLLPLGHFAPMVKAFMQLDLVCKPCTVHMGRLNFQGMSTLSRANLKSKDDWWRPMRAGLE
jgi:hypothetical protein